MSLSKLHHVKMLSKLLGEVDESLLIKVLETGSITHINTDELLFKQGDIQKSLFIVLSGRFRAVAEMEDGKHLLGDIAEGEPVGEFALFTNEPRSASVFAVRPSTVLELDEDEYFQIITMQPEFAMKMTQILVNRLKRNNLQKHLEAPPKNIAVINLQPDNDITPWTNAIETQFEQTGVAFKVYDHESWSTDDQHVLFEEMEENDALKFMICSAAFPDWSRQCLIYADLVIVASDFYASSDIYAIEEALDLYQQHILNKKIYLLLLHPDNAPQPENTIRWYKNRKLNLHIHFRKNHSGDTARFCRIVTHQAVGLVLGGGGAKGFAHVGAVKAMLNAGIQIDFLGGTSAGALYGLGIVYCDFDVEKIEYYSNDSAKRKLTSNDYTFPILSLMSGNKMLKYLKFMFGNTCLEDFWISAYCISTNYSAASIKIHESGPAWKQIQASIAIPGVFPPVILDSQLHVDGGVMDNLPIEPMYRYPVGHIIAVSLTSLNSLNVGFKEIPSSWTLLWDKITGRKRYRLPALSSLIINSLTLNSKQKQEQNKSGVSLYVELKLKGIGLMDDTKWKLIIQKGQEQMEETLNSLKSSEKFW
jgi:predicted acylesterase/phospholipase RssA